MATYKINLKEELPQLKVNTQILIEELADLASTTKDNIGLSASFNNEKKISKCTIEDFTDTLTRRQVVEALLAHNPEKDDQEEIAEDPKRSFSKLVELVLDLEQRVIALEGKGK